MTLTSLPTLPTGEGPSVSHSFLHLSFTNLLAHFFIMKMDWILSTGLPCLPGATELRVRRLHSRFANFPASRLNTKKDISRLIESWQNLNCGLQQSTTANDFQRANLLGNLETVLDTPIMRYSNCRERIVRDCVLTQRALAILRLSESFLTARSTLVLL